MARAKDRPGPPFHTTFATQQRKKSGTAPFRGQIFATQLVINVARYRGLTERGRERERELSAHDGRILIINCLQERGKRGQKEVAGKNRKTLAV